MLLHFSYYSQGLYSVQLLFRDPMNMSIVRKLCSYVQRRQAVEELYWCQPGTHAWYLSWWQRADSQNDGFWENGHKATAWRKWNGKCQDEDKWEGAKGRKRSNMETETHKCGKHRNHMKGQWKKHKGSDIGFISPYLSHFSVGCFQLPVFRSLYLLQRRLRQLSQI